MKLNNIQTIMSMTAKTTFVTVHSLLRPPMNFVQSAPGALQPHHLLKLIS